MKKIISLTITSLIALGCMGGMLAGCSVEPDNYGPVQDKLYFVPGTYVSGGEKVSNTITSGATKLSAEESAQMFTENIYRCTLNAGMALPVPETQRVDSEGEPYTFNGWWMIKNATVTYFETVPTVTETTILYADWRADLSQRKDPIIPDGYVEVIPNHYLTVTRAGGEEERVTLHYSYTSQPNAESLGYMGSVELYVDGLELNYGDVFSVYTTGLTDSEDAVMAPVMDANGKCTIDLEAAGDGSNDTEDYLEATEGNKREPSFLTYIAEESGSFKIYIKFYVGGSYMAVYMEPMTTA